MRATYLAVMLLISSFSLHGQEAPEGDYPPLPEYRVFGTPATEADSEAIAELMGRFGAAWGSQDVAGVVSTYAEDAEWTNAFGDVVRGHDELTAFLTRLFQRFDAPAEVGSENAGEPPRRGRISRRYIGADAAVLHGWVLSDWGVNRDGAGPRRVHTTFVLEKRNGSWKIVHQVIMDVRR